MQKEIATFCPICSGHCAAKAVVEDGKVIKWVRDRDSGLPSEPCPTFKGRSNIEILSHPERLKHPLKRTGERGEGKWEQVSWDEALEAIAGKLNDAKQKYGPESFGVGLGEPKGLEFHFGHRLAGAFGTPNVATPSHLCAATIAAAAFLTFGPGVAYGLADMDNLPRMIAVWGSNLVQTGGAHAREWLRAALDSGAKLIVVDPKKIDLAQKADLWIRPRPGSDAALAMGMIKLVIEQKRYDENFVSSWTMGFDALRDEVKQFTLKDVEALTWVPQKQIEAFVEMFTDLKPACIRMGNVFSHGVNSLQAARTVCILSAIMGPANIPGWGVSVTPAPWTRPGRLALLSQFPRKPEQSLGGKFKWAMNTAYIPYQALTKGILAGKVKAAFFILSNPLSSYPDARETYEALEKLELIVVSELFMTPTAAMADFVLPAATSGEHDTEGFWSDFGGTLRSYPKLVDPPGQAWPDVKIIIELAKKLGIEEHFPNTTEEINELVLEPSGLSLEEYRQKRILRETKAYIDPEEIQLRTPSGKIEIRSEQMEAYGSSPTLLWKELSRFNAGELSEDYPLLLTTRVEDAYKLTGFKHIPSMRRRKPEPTLEMNHETAQSLGLTEGQMVSIESKKGRITQKLTLDKDLDPRVVYASFGWWFPEEPANLYEWDKANVNILLDNTQEEPATGSVELRGIPCRVYEI